MKFQIIVMTCKIVQFFIQQLNMIIFRLLIWSGNKLSQFNLSSTGKIYVSGDLLYYQDYQGVHCYSIADENDELLVEGEVNNYIVTNNTIVYTNYDDDLMTSDGILYR